MKASLPADEAQRLETLRGLSLLDTPGEAVFDALTTLAARVCNTPIALLTFIDAERQWFKARVGFELKELSRDTSFCAHAILGTATCVVPDALADPRFQDNPLVTSVRGFRFYAGVPIRLGLGSAIGTLCVIDTKPRELTPEQKTGLEDLAALATAQLESRLPRTERGLLDEATRLNQELSALVSITDCAISTLDLEELMKVLLERLVHVMKADAGAILLEEGGRLVVRATTGFGANVGKLPDLPFGEGVGGLTFVTGEPTYIADVQNDPRVIGIFLKEQRVVSMLGVPLKTRDWLIGVLHIDWRHSHAESANDIQLLETAADRCATAIVNARLFQELRATNVRAERVRDRLALALGAADLGVWDLDVPSQSVIWDSANERIFGLPAGTFDGRYETFERLVHPADVAAVRKASGGALKGAVYTTSFRIVRPDGKLRWLSVRGHLQRAPDGEPLHLLGVTEDVTEEHQHAEERELLLLSERQARGEAERAGERVVNVNEQLRALSARIQTVREEEAVRIAREIHDELGQLLTALRMDVSWIRSRVAKIDSKETAPLLARADGMAKLTEQTIRTVQRISEELRPSALDQLGLEAAIEALLAGLAERSGIATSLVGTLGDRRLGDPIETGVFRIVQELLTNVARHSQASAVRVELRLEGDGGESLVVRVSDDGRGIRPAELSDPRSLGLAGIRERALLLGGRADFSGEPGRGTVALVTISRREGTSP